MAPIADPPDCVVALGAVVEGFSSPSFVAVAADEAVVASADAEVAMVGSSAAASEAAVDEKRSKLSFKIHTAPPTPRMSSNMATTTMTVRLGSQELCITTSLAPSRQDDPSDSLSAAALLPPETRPPRRCYPCYSCRVPHCKAEPPSPVVPSRESHHKTGEGEKGSNLLAPRPRGRKGEKCGVQPREEVLL